MAAGGACRAGFGLIAMDFSPQTDLTIGNEIYQLASSLFPICRSITGPGVRETLAVMAETIPLAVHDVPSGRQVFDWVVPPEWRINEATIQDASGRKIVDFADNNLHVMGYSIPVRRTMTRSELEPYIHTLPDQPDAIPYRTSYYQPNWGFCLAHNRWQEAGDGPFEVVIDSHFCEGSLTYGTFTHKGTSERDVLFSAHICHPSMANDNCSGLAVLTHVAQALRGRTTRYNYRFLFAPGTIGALCWLHENEQHLHRLDHGLVVSCLGDSGGPTYKRSRQGNAVIDRIMAQVECDGRKASLQDFSPYGYDERQFCSPGFNLPVGLLQRSAHGSFPQYHTSDDNLSFITPGDLQAAYRMIMDVIDILEADYVPVNLSPKGEPQLGRRGLYSATGGHRTAPPDTLACLWVLNLADGKHSLLDMAERSGVPFATLADSARRLREIQLLT